MSQSGDIVQAIKQLEQRHTFKNRCAIGASYGGYSALMLSILHPDLVDCVIARFGVYDLPLMFNQSNLKTSEEWLEKVENTVGEYNEDLFTISPLYLADKITKPLLLTAGYNDDVAAFEHTQRLDYVLTKLGKPFEHAYYKRTGHGHSRWSGDQHEHVMIDDFIRRQLSIPPLRIEETSEVEQKLLTDDLLLVANSFFGQYRVDRDEQRAAYFYQQAAATGQPEAIYRLALSQLNARESMTPVTQSIALLTQAAELDNADAAYQLAYRYLLDYRFDAPQPALAKPYLDKAIALDEGYRTTLLKLLWDCVWAEDGPTNCLTALKALQEDEDDQYQYLQHEIIAEMVSRFEGDQESLEALLKEFSNIAPSTTTVDVVNSGLLSELANGEEGFTSVEGHSLEPGDKLAVRFKVGSGTMFRAADEALGIVAEWQGVQPNGEVITLDRTFLYGHPRAYRYGKKTPWQSARYLSTYDLQFTAIKLVLKDIYSHPQLTETFTLH